MIAALDQHAGQRRRPGTPPESRPAIDAPMWFGISVLHDVGRVGAEHHQLAVRHVDDAHDAERDRQADGDQHQHRAEAQAEEQRLDAGVERARLIDAMRRRRAAAVRTSLVGFDEAAVGAPSRRSAVEPVADVRAQAARQRLDRGEARLGCRRCRGRPAPGRSRSRCLTPASVSIADALRAAARRVASSSDRSISRTACEPHRRIRVRQRRSAPPRSAARVRRRLLVPILRAARRAGAAAGVFQRHRIDEVGGRQRSSADVAMKTPWSGCADDRRSSRKRAQHGARAGVAARDELLDDRFLVGEARRRAGSRRGRRNRSVRPAWTACAGRRRRQHRAAARRAPAER